MSRHPGNRVPVRTPMVGVEEELAVDEEDECEITVKGCLWSVLLLLVTVAVVFLCCLGGHLVARWDCDARGGHWRASTYTCIGAER